MNKIVKKTLPVLLTSAAVIVALLVLRQLWVYYMDEPWTRDAHVGADVVQVAPDVSGLVETVQVADNQAVSKGDLLFVVDRARYRIALEQARPAWPSARPRWPSCAARSAATAACRTWLPPRTPKCDAPSCRPHRPRWPRHRPPWTWPSSTWAAPRCAPADGRVNDRTMRVGDYVVAGKPVLALLDTGSFRIDGYFEETRLRGVAPGQRVDIRLMGESTRCVAMWSIAAGIEDRYRSNGSSCCRT